MLKIYLNNLHKLIVEYNIKDLLITNINLSDNDNIIIDKYINDTIEYKNIILNILSLLIKNLNNINDKKIIYYIIVYSLHLFGYKKCIFLKKYININKYINNYLIFINIINNIIVLVNINTINNIFELINQCKINKFMSLLNINDQNIIYEELIFLNTI